MLPIPEALQVSLQWWIDEQVHSPPELAPIRFLSLTMSADPTLVLDPASQEPEYGTANHRVFETRVPVQDCLTVDVHSQSEKYLLQGECPRLRDVYRSRGCFRDGPMSFLSRGILDRRQ
jgi:hypothetical protein